MFLATTALADFWDKDQEILFLGSWCLRYDRQADWRDVKGQVLANPWADRQRMARAFHYCTEVFESVLAKLTEYLNAVHGVKHSSRYWRVVLGPWLIEYTQIIYDRYIHVLDALKRDPDLSTTCLDPQCFVTPRHFKDFVSWHTDDPYNLQLYSQVFQFLGRSTPVKVWSKGATPQFPRQCSETFDARMPLRGLVNYLTMRVAPPTVMANVNMSARSFGMVMLKSGFSVWPVMANPAEPDDATVIPRLRVGLASVAGRDQFESILMKSLVVNFPTLYLEGYQGFRQRCLSGWQQAPKVVVSENGWYTNESFKFCAAEWGEGGAKLFGIQHGGGYGTCAVVSAEWHERKMTDRFFTWGWAESEQAEQLANLPNPRLCVLAKRTRKKAFLGNGLLLVSNVFPRYTYRFHTQPVGDQVAQYLDEKILFVKGLTESVRAQTHVRLHTGDYGWAVKLRLMAGCPGITLDNGCTLSEKRLASCRLAAFDYPGTAYLEGLVLNVPSVLFWNPALWGERDSAAPYFAELRRALILHDDPKAAAAHASAVYEDPWRWWGDATVQSARRRFVDRFAYTRSDWAALWVETLQREVASAPAVTPKSAIGRARV